jgi:hypothetical protein
VKQSPLNSSLQRLAKRVTEKGTVRTLKFETLRPEAREHNKFDGGRKQPKQHILRACSILNFVDPILSGNLKTLHVDLADCFRSRYPADSPHYCPSTAKLLPSSFHARIRLPRICAECFEGHGDTSEKQGEHLETTCLKTLTVCLSVCDEYCADVFRNNHLFGVYARSCRDPKAGRGTDSIDVVSTQPSWTNFKLVKGIKSLASRSPYLQIARVLHHPERDSSRRLHVFDCLTGQGQMMSHDNDWDAEIQSDEDDSEKSELPSESEIFSLSSDGEEQQASSKSNMPLTWSEELAREVPYFANRLYGRR